MFPNVEAYQMVISLQLYKRACIEFLQKCSSGSIVLALDSPIQTGQANIGNNSPPNSKVIWGISQPRSLEFDLAKASNSTQIRHSTNPELNHYCLEVLLNFHKVRVLYSCGSTTTVRSAGLAHQRSLSVGLPLRV